MVKKTHEKAAEEDSGGQPSGAAGGVKDSAQQIWLAGLGAFAKAQQEGGKVFEALVREGAAIQRKTQAAAEERISEATSRMASMATDISSRASSQWGKLENIFEERVAKAIKQLGVPSAKDIEMLSERIDELNRTVSKLSAKTAGSRRSAASGSAKTAGKTATKRTSTRKSA